MKTDHRDLARGEAISKIHWGADVDEVVELLGTKYGISGSEADSLIEEALVARSRAVRQKAAITLAFALVGLVVAITYFAIQYFVGFIRVGPGLILMGALGLTSAAVAGRSVFRLLTGQSTGPV